MQKNWYIVYTRPKYEQKIVKFLSKKGIENFCPLNLAKTRSFKTTRLIREPLFKTYVFVYLEEKELPLLRHVYGIINLVYWGANPAIIKADEIEAIKEFTHIYKEIILQKLKVNLVNDRNILDTMSASMDGKILRIINKEIIVKLPSLGFSMVARIKEESVLERELPFFQRVSG